MIRKIIRVFMAAGLIVIAGCVKETYNMDNLSKKAQLSPSFAISAVKGDVTFKDIVKSNDTVVFDNDNFVTLVFRRNNVIDLSPSDFTSSTGSLGPDAYPLTRSILNQGLPSEYAYVGQWIAPIDPDTIDLGIDDVLSKVSGDILVANPSITLTYTNSFVDPILVDFSARGVKESSTTELNLSPFTIDHPADTTKPAVTSVFTIDKNNSSIQNIVSMPPEKIYFSGEARINVSTENIYNDFFTGRRFTGSIEVDVPLQLRINDLQYTETSDNFLADVFKDNDNLNWDNFKLFRVDFDVKNGFPFDVSVEMSLVDSLSHAVISTISATDLLAPATIDTDGKSTTATESKTSLTFTKEFFESINKSDKIIFIFRMNTTGDGASDVKIYSDYSLDFKASLFLQPEIKFDF